MRLGLRLLFGFFLVTGLAGFFVLRVFVAEVKPSVREVMEDMMVDTANILAELASDDLAQGTMQSGRFATHVRNYARRPIDAAIWGLSKQSLDFRIYVTDAGGAVLFDSDNTAAGQDYSQWRDVARTLRGEYGARATRQVQSDDKTSVMYVAAPVNHAGKVIGVLTVAKPISTIQAFIDRAERKILLSGLLLLAISALIGVVVTLWVVAGVRRLRRYANAVEQGAKPAVPDIPGELGDLARAMHAMRERLERHEYIEDYVRALTHELKSPLAALRGAGELLQDDLPPAARREFSAQVLDQTLRMQTLVDRMLELSKLEHRQASIQKVPVALAPFLDRFARSVAADGTGHAIRIKPSPEAVTILAEPALLELALNNLLDNARAFAPAGSTILIEATSGQIAVQDQGPGVEDYALARLGERFYSTARPHSQTKGSGLGLAIVRQIMALHGGRMTVRNTHPGLRVELHFAP